MDRSRGPMPSPVNNASPVARALPAEAEFGPPAPSPPVVTIPPVHITGDAGACELVRRHDAAAGAPCSPPPPMPPPCGAEKVAAVEKLLPMAIDVAGTLAAGAAGGPLGIGLGVAKLFYDSVQEGKALRALYDCEP